MQLLNTPFFGLTLTMAAFVLFSKFSKKVQLPLANPILLSVAFIIFVLHFFSIPLSFYNQGGEIINMFLAPTMVAIAYSLYKQLKVLERCVLPILVGSLVGSIVSLLSVIFFCSLFGFDNLIISTMLPKSVTTPIAIELSLNKGGLVSVTVAAVIITGIMGAMFAPWAIKFFHIRNKVAAGVAIGTSSHGVGTSKAFELGELEGATSGIAIGIAGLWTVLLTMLF